MKARLPLLSAALVSLLLSAPASAVTVELFHETFDGNDQNWSYTSTGARSYDKSWTEADTVKPGYKGIKLGSTTGTTGSITSESFSISNTAADVSIVVIAAAYQNSGGGKEGIAVTVFDSTDTQIYAGGVGELTQHSSTTKDEIPTSPAFTHEFTIPAASLPASGGIYMKIESTYTKSGQRRALLGDVRVTQTYSSGLPKLPTPVVSAPSTNFYGFALSWNAVSGANNGYDVTLSPAAGNVTVSGTTAIVTNLAESTTYTASVVAKGDGTTNDDSDPATLPVTTLTAPAVTAPELTPSAVSSSSFTVSWPGQSAADHFSVRAWTFVPVDVATEYFADYAADGTPPEGWNFQNKGTPYGDQAENPVDFVDNGDWIGSPVFGGVVTNVSFRLRRWTESGSTFTVYGSTGSDDESEWKTTENTLAVLTGLQTQVYNIPIDVSKGIKRLFFQYTKSSGNVSIGTFSVKGTGVGKARSYLEGYGSDSAGVRVEGTSVTISNPVAGETNYVEVTATGLTGRTASSTLAVAVPAPLTFSPVIFVK